jgi:hypothetical protein
MESPMTALTSPALPVPALGTALGPAGDAYVASLQVALKVDGQPVGILDGPRFETLMLALRLRHLAFHARTRALIPGQVPAATLDAAIARYWAALDAHAVDTPGLLATAEALELAVRGAGVLTWAQAN